ncbi:transcriptional regulator, TetR family [Ketogulonicigenium robustum]|uniref:Transcriptional regulator, TetR family n=1 Tax=Ketogulonicigenium robustum TaxID=92947 RepID=A0A1W6NZX4_9RHOB|nr:TetR/AcrR family transcriptional regulator [Ketogulonicigenium robustum]ARO14749.1 transcriptional regulator, TetR family [Ketogulonicigenium robustum]
MAKTGYHHGNLRAALLDAALALVAERGPNGFTLSEAARHAGVTPAAIYRHFAGRKDVLVAAADHGFAMLAADLQKITPAAGPGPLRAAAQTFLAFARRQPGHYIAMFESGLLADPVLSDAIDRTFHVMDALAAPMQITAIPPRAITAQLLAICHGTVELYARSEKTDAAQLLDGAVSIYLRGLTVNPSE